MDSKKEEKKDDKKKDEKVTKPVWYKTWWGVLIVIFLILPFFLIWQVWAKTDWSKGAKIAVTAVIAVLYIIFLSSTGSDTNTQTAKTSPTTATEAKIEEKTPEPKKEEIKDLDADVTYNNVAFKIDNKEDKDWKNCKFQVNSKYEFKTSEGIKAKDSVIVLFSDFTKGDGTRFNFYETKAKSMFIACDDADGKHRTNYFTIN
jgi:ABC-type transport system involved in cytochrome bd biosynthesis fused ATPase/permease subunit